MLVVLFEPERTQFDLQWRMFGVHVRVHPWFWIMAAVLGWGYERLGLEYLLVWILCVFVSILVHEFGHVFMGRLFGAQSHIILYTFGGLAVGSSALRNRWQRIAVFFAGPAAGFLLWGLLQCIPLPDEHGQHSLRWFALRALNWINLGWGIINLVPIWPLDGGQISRELFDWLMPKNGVRTAFMVSIVLCSILALNCALLASREQGLPMLDRIPFLDELGGWYNAILFAALAIYNYQALQRETARWGWERNVDRWNR
jgi:Zn-dependent protease